MPNIDSTYHVRRDRRGANTASAVSYTHLDVYKRQELAKAVCEKMGWELKLEPIDWDAKDALIGSGTINCIWNGFTMENRENDYTFSEPYMYNEQVVVVKKDSDAKKLEDLAGKTVLTQVDSAALHVLEDEKGQKALADTFKELQTIGDYNNAFMQLESGMVDAVACDRSIASYQMAAKPDTYVKLGVLAPENYAVGFKKGDTELAKQVSDALKALDEDGTVKQLCDKLSLIHICGAFNFGKVMLEGIADDKGSQAFVEFQNENLSCTVDGEIVATVPDLICLVDPDTFIPVPTDALKYLSLIHI